MQKLLAKYRNIAERVMEIGVAAILLVVPLYPKFPFISVPGTYVSIRPEDFLIFVTTLCFLVVMASAWREYLKDKLVVTFLIFWGVTLVSLLAGMLLTQTVSPLIGVLHWARRVEYMIPFFIGMYVIRKPGNLAFYLKCLGAVVIYALLYGLGQRYLNFPIVTTQNLEYAKGVALRYSPGAHIPSTFAGHYDLASYLVLVLPAFLVLIFYVKGKLKIVPLGVVLSGFWLLVAAVSRISLVSFVVNAAASLFLIRKYKFIPVVIVLAGVWAGLSTDVVGRYSRVIEVGIKNLMQKKILMIVKPVWAQEEDVLGTRRIVTETPTPVPVPVFEDRSTSIRLNVEWPRAWRAFTKNPLLGTGYSSITLATDNDYLRALGETGILGLVAFVLVLVRVIAKLLRAIPLPKKLTLETVALAGVIGALPGVLLNAVFIDIFEASKFAVIFWLMMGFGVALAGRSKNEAVD